MINLKKRMALIAGATLMAFPAFADRDGNSGGDPVIAYKGAKSPPTINRYDLPDVPKLLYKVSSKLDTKINLGHLKQPLIRAISAEELVDKHGLNIAELYNPNRFSMKAKQAKKLYKSILKYEEATNDLDIFSVHHPLNEYLNIEGFKKWSYSLNDDEETPSNDRSLDKALELKSNIVIHNENFSDLMDNLQIHLNVDPKTGCSNGCEEDLYADFPKEGIRFQLDCAVNDIEFTVSNNIVLKSPYSPINETINIGSPKLSRHLWANYCELEKPKSYRVKVECALTPATLKDYQNAVQTIKNPKMGDYAELTDALNIKIDSHNKVPHFFEGSSSVNLISKGEKDFVGSDFSKVDLAKINNPVVSNTYFRYTIFRFNTESNDFRGSEMNLSRLSGKYIPFSDYKEVGYFLRDITLSYLKEAKEIKNPNKPKNFRKQK